MRWNVLLLALALLGVFFLSSCVVTVPPPRQKRVHVSYTRSGCRVKRVVFHCYYPYGHLVWRSVRCPDGRRSRTKRVIRRRSCRNNYHAP